MLDNIQIKFNVFHLKPEDNLTTMHNQDMMASCNNHKIVNTHIGIRWHNL
jgi:hypothetical protein